MPSDKDSPFSDPIREAELAVEIAERLHRLADEATEQARAACERANTMPLFFERLTPAEKAEEGR